MKLVLWFLPHFCVRCSFLILEVEESACNVTFGCALPRVRVALVLYPIALDSTCITFQYKTFLGHQFSVFYSHQFFTRTLVPSSAHILCSILCRISLPPLEVQLFLTTSPLRQPAFTVPLVRLHTCKYMKTGSFHHVCLVQTYLGPSHP